MKIDRAFLRSKVARRIFVLFISCALLPITALALISFSRVTQELRQQSQTRLFQAAKAAGFVILERLQFLSAELKTAASGLGPDATAANHLSATLPMEALASRCLNSLEVITPLGERIPVFGHLNEVPALKPEEEMHLASGKTLLSTRSDSNGPPRITIRTGLENPQGHWQLIGEIKDDYLWGDVVETTLPPMAELCILDHSGEMLFSSVSDLRSLPENKTSQILQGPAGQFDWKHKNVEYMAIYWSLFTKYEFHVPKWIVVMSESKAHILLPMADFERSFTLILLLTILVVLFLSFKQIRRSLVPLEKLQEGTKRIAERDFDTRVSVKSGDEFEELANSFNAMAGRLGMQFNAMTTMNEIDRSILSALDTEKIVGTVLARLQELFPCDCAGVALLEARNELAGSMHIGNNHFTAKMRLEPVKLAPQDVQNLYAHPEYLLVDMEGEAPRYLEPFSDRGMKMFLVLPVFVNQRLCGVITLGYRDPALLSEEDRIHARQVADQVAVALSNAKLIEDLEELNWGTLYALAGAIDAKSPWTAGHSERVTELAVKIGEAMGLGKKELDDLHRAGLLHDIGKLGIPPEILDKPGMLSETEFEFMRKHAQLGAKILEPIAAYATVRPLVLHHHEHFDGTGYPDGLSGEETPLGARIFSLADKYDALISDRPYRPGMEPDKVIQYIASRAGREFDPKVVEAFLKVMASSSCR